MDSIGVISASLVRPSLFARGDRDTRLYDRGQRAPVQSCSELWMIFRIWCRMCTALSDTYLSPFYFSTHCQRSHIVVPDVVDSPMIADREVRQPDALFKQMGMQRREAQSSPDWG